MAAHQRASDTSQPSRASHIARKRRLLPRSRARQPDSTARRSPFCAAQPRQPRTPSRSTATSRFIALTTPEISSQSVLMRSSSAGTPLARSRRLSSWRRGGTIATPRTRPYGRGRPHLPIAARSGHGAGVTASGVDESRSGPLATAGADLPLWFYGHLLGDSTGPATRGKQGSTTRTSKPRRA